MPIIKTNNELISLCKEIDAYQRFALDLEFIPERTYEPELCLIQVSTDNNAYIVDPLITLNLQELWERVSDPNILTILHAGDQDLDLIYQRSGLIPQNISDTQIAAGFIGFGYPVGYSKLLRELLGVCITKTESYTDWTNRPLSLAQVNYALDDVKHLLALHDAIDSNLQKLGRKTWATDECKKYADRNYYDKDTANDFLRIKGASSLNRKSLAILKTLCDWRHKQAAASNRPLRSILQDNILFEFAKHPPESLNDIQRIRGIRQDQLKQFGTNILQAVQESLQISEENLPKWPSSKIYPKREIIIVDFLFTLLKVIIYDRALAAELVATRNDLEAFVRMHFEQTVNKSPLLSGWRYELVGKYLLEVLNGSACTVQLSSNDVPVHLEVNSKNIEH